MKIVMLPSGPHDQIEQARIDSVLCASQSVCECGKEFRARPFHLAGNLAMAHESLTGHVTRPVKAAAR